MEFIYFSSVSVFLPLLDCQFFLSDVVMFARWHVTCPIDNLPWQGNTFCDKRNIGMCPKWCIKPYCLPIMLSNWGPHHHQKNRTRTFQSIQPRENPLELMVSARFFAPAFLNCLVPHPAICPRWPTSLARKKTALLCTWQTLKTPKGRSAMLLHSSILWKLLLMPCAVETASRHDTPSASWRCLHCCPICAPPPSQCACPPLLTLINLTWCSAEEQCENQVYGMTHCPAGEPSMNLRSER